MRIEVEAKVIIQAVESVTPISKSPEEIVLAVEMALNEMGTVEIEGVSNCGIRIHMGAITKPKPKRKFRKETDGE